MLNIALDGAVISAQEKTALAGIDLKRFAAEVENSNISEKSGNIISRFLHFAPGAKNSNVRIDDLFRKHLRVPELRDTLDEMLCTSGKGLAEKTIALEKIDRALEKVMLRSPNKEMRIKLCERFADLFVKAYFT